MTYWGCYNLQIRQIYKFVDKKIKNSSNPKQVPIPKSMQNL